MINIKIQKIHDDAIIPTQQKQGDLYDLHAYNFSVYYNGALVDTQYQFKLRPKQTVLVKTGICLQFPKKKYDSNIWVYTNIKAAETENYAVADIRPRSGLALKHGITVLNSPGTIDHTYNKEVGVILINHGVRPYVIHKDDRIAQMLIRPLYNSNLTETKEIKGSDRDGFGSTGK